MLAWPRYLVGCGLFCVLMLISYIPMAELALSPFACERGQDRVLRMISESASNVECSWQEPQWAAMASVAMVAAVLYVIGVPVALFLILVTGKRLAQHDNFLCFHASDSSVLTNEMSP